MVSVSDDALSLVCRHAAYYTCPSILLLLLLEDMKALRRMPPPKRENLRRVESDGTHDGFTVIPTAEITIDVVQVCAIGHYLVVH